MKLNQTKPKQLEQLKIAFSIDELSDIIGLSSRKLWQELHQGRLAYIRIGRRVLVTKEQLNQYLLKNSVSTFDPEAAAFEILKL